LIRLCFALLILGMLGCQTEEYPIPIAGSTYRIGKDVPDKGSEERIDVLTGWTECVNAGIRDLDLCMPRVDRAAAETRISFMLRDPKTSATLNRSLDAEQITVSHDGQQVEDYELIPHDPVSGGQLFILLIDGSGSMYDNDGERAKKVYTALLTKSVVDGFFPEGNTKTGVVLLRFAGPDVVGLDGGPPKVVKSAAEYRKVITENLLVPTRGYTFLYQAIRYSVTELLTLKNINTFLGLRGAAPTLIVLTDGFNNEAGSDVCSDNVTRLNETLDVIRQSRASSGGSARTSVYSVGLGQSYNPRKSSGSANRFKRSITSRELCGRYADHKIDGHLEDYGIDDVSLEWIAEAGGGASFVRKNPQGLAEVFAKTSAVRYTWYELRYKVPDSFHHRKSFEVKIRLASLARAETAIKLHPSAWMDAPGGFIETGEKWSRRTPFRSTFALFMPMLGLLVVLTFMGPAWFNARRALFRRARNRKK